jgi:hypothetical protein
MSARHAVTAVFALLSMVPLTPGAALAQSASTAGSIAGVVKDTTGAVLPGVTVEAASPALIEKVRSVVTDTEGQYKILDLRPGTYTVTFTLPGFSMYKREGIELTTGFTATANAEMKVGSLEETVTVTGASPVVDVQNVRTQNLLTNAVLDAIPANKSPFGYAALTLGATLNVSQQDVGGNRGENTGSAWGIHGSKGDDSKYFQDGMTAFTGMDATGPNSRLYYPNQAGMLETNIQTGGMTAEAPTGGPQIHLVPKEGSNSFKLYFAGSGTGPALQGENLDDELRAAGLTTTATVAKIYDVGIGIGGPIKQDKWWFYTAHRYWGSQEYQPGIWFNKTPHSRFYTPDLDKPAFLYLHGAQSSVRLTWQASQRNKFTFSTELQKNCNCYVFTDSARAPEASTMQRYWPQSLSQVTWSYPRTNRLLFEGGTTGVYAPNNAGIPPEVNKDDIAMLELSTGFRYNAKLEALRAINEYSQDTSNYVHQSGQRFAVSYVTGSHAFKTGFLGFLGARRMHIEHSGGAVRYEFLRGVPAQLTQSASPNLTRNRIWDYGMFAQDQWTVRKLTLNMGVRFDHIRGWAPAERIPAGPFVPERNFDAVDSIPNWNDIVRRDQQHAVRHAGLYAAVRG